MRNCFTFQVYEAFFIPIYQFYQPVLYLFNFRKSGTRSVELFDIYDRFLPPAVIAPQTANYVPQSLFQNKNSQNNIPSSPQNQTSTNDPTYTFIYEETASKGENKCREVIEKLTGKRFYKTRPSFLKNPITGAFLELDIYILIFLIGLRKKKG